MKIEVKYNTNSKAIGTIFEERDFDTVQFCTVYNSASSWAQISRQSGHKIRGAFIVEIAGTQIEAFRPYMQHTIQGRID